MFLFECVHVAFSIGFISRNLTVSEMSLNIKNFNHFAWLNYFFFMINSHNYHWKVDFSAFLYPMNAFVLAGKGMGFY